MVTARSITSRVRAGVKKRRDRQRGRSSSSQPNSGRKTIHVNFKRDSKGEVFDANKKRNRNRKGKAINPQALKQTVTTSSRTTPLKSSINKSKIPKNEVIIHDITNNRKFNRNPVSPRIYDRFSLARDIAIEENNKKNQEFRFIPTVEAIQKENESFAQRWRSKAAKQEFEAIKNQRLGTKKGTKASVQALGSSIIAGAGGTVELVKNIVTKPKNTAIGFYQSGKKIVQDPAAAVKHLTDNPLQTTGELVGSFGLLKGAGKVGQLGKVQYIKTGAKFIPKEKVFAAEVLSGKTKLPLSKSVEESLKRFEAAQGKVVTASPSKLKGKEAGLGRKGQFGLEDPGIYVTPKGTASSQFTQIAQKGATKKFTLNPFKEIFKKIPTVTEFQTSGITRLPRKVIEQPGFRGVQEFFETIPENTKAFITKRSEIGQGAIKPKKFVSDMNINLKDISNKFRLTITRNGKTFKTDKIKKGDILTEAGTSELESVLGVKQKFKSDHKSVIGRIKGFDEYTILEGQPVALRKAKLIGSTTKGKTPFLESPLIKTNSKITKGKQIKGETKSFSDIQQGVVYRSPYKGSIVGSTPYLKYGSSVGFPLTGFVNSISKTVSEPARSSMIDISSTPIITSPVISNPYTGGSSGGGSSGGGSSGGGSSTGGSSGGGENFITGKSIPLKKPLTQEEKLQLEIINELSKTAYQPIYQHKGRKIKGELLATKKEAIAKAMNVTDESRIEGFDIKKVTALKKKIRRYNQTAPSYKFKMKGGMFKEKRYYRKDKIGEKQGNFNIFPYVFSR